MSELEDIVTRLLELSRQPEHVANPEIVNFRGSENDQKMRAALQGLTLATADEAEAFLRSQFGGEDYDTALADVRGKLAAYREQSPGEALGFEIGGAALPAVLAAMASGGSGGGAVAARFFPSLAKAAGIGAAQGGAYSFASGEDDFGARVSRVPVGATLGLAGGALGYAGSRAVTSGVAKLLDYTKRQFGPRVSKSVEDEFLRVLQDSGLTVDEVIDGIADGTLPVEMGVAGNKTMATIARAYRAQSRAGGDTLESALRDRPAAQRKELMDYLAQEMAPPGDSNIIRNVTTGIDDMKAEEGAQYRNIFATADEIPDELVVELSDALKRYPAAAKDAAAIYTARTGEKPFFRFDEDIGEMVFARKPTLEEAEIIRRGLKNATDKLFSGGSGTLGAEVGSLERTVRGLLDDTSSPLKQTRARWSNIESQREAFEAGRKVLSGSAAEAEILMDEMSRKGDDVLAAFRAGAAEAYQRRAATGSAASLPGNIVNPERKEGQILGVIFPEDKLDELTGRAERAATAQETKDIVLGGSPTSITDGRIAQNNAGQMLDTVLDISSGSPSAIIRTVASMLKKTRPKLSDKDVMRLASLMVEQNPDVMRAAMKNTRVPQIALQGVQNLMTRLPGKVGFGTAQASGAASEPAKGLLVDWLND